jgi:hypothetical protein
MFFAICSLHRCDIGRVGGFIHHVVAPTIEEVSLSTSTGNPTVPMDDGWRSRAIEIFR